MGSPSAGKCTPQICPTTSNICQIRLELETFVITGPSTISTSIGLFLGGEGSAAGVEQSDKGISSIYSSGSHFTMWRRKWTCLLNRNVQDSNYSRCRAA